MRNPLKLFVTGLAIHLLLLGAPAALRADDPALKEDLRKFYQDTRKSFLSEVEKVISGAEERFLAAVLELVEKRVGERISKLEAEIKTRDKKLSELEARVNELTKKPAAPPAPVAPPTPPSSSFLGVAHTDVPQETRTKLKIEGGALVTQVIEESPAAAAGLQTGDVVVDLNGTAINSGNLAATVATFKPDQDVNVTFFRDGNRTTKALKLVDRDKFLAGIEAKRKAAAEPKKEPIVLGITVREEGDKLLVDAVEDGLTGSVLGLKTGDRLTQLNGKELKVLEDVSGELKKILAGDAFNLIYVRGDETVTVKGVGSRGKEGAKVVDRTAVKPKEEPKKETKPAFLGLSVVPDATGVVVDDVVADAAAAAAGVKKGDLIKKANGKDIAQIEHLKEVLSKLNAGDKLSLELAREGKAVELKDIVLKAEGEKVAAAASEKPKEEPKPAPPAAKKKGALGILASQTLDGKVVVKTVNPGGPAEKAELKVGDIILKINDKAVGSFDDLAGVLQALFAGDAVSFRIQRGSEEKDVKVTLGEAAS